MSRTRQTAAAALLSAGAAWPCFAAPPAAIVPTAIVEEAPVGLAVQAMDYLSEGQAIALKPGQRLVIGYLESCTVETVTGGRVVIGKTESRVDGGSVARKTVGCEGSRLVLTEAQAGKSGVMIFRKAPRAGGRAQLPKADVVVRGQCPVLVLRAGGTAQVTIERLDRGEPARQIEVPGRLDLATVKLRFDPGGLYRAQAGGAATVFMIDPNASTDASAEPGPILARLVPM